VSGQLADLAHRAHEAFEERGVAGWEDQWAEDVVLDFRPAQVPGLGVYRGKEQCRAACEEWIATFEHWSIELGEIEGMGANTAIVEWVQRGTARGGEATAELRYWLLTTARDGRLGHMAIYLDRDEARGAAVAGPN
jgi:ketosteroid isomerase-like protein